MEFPHPSAKIRQIQTCWSKKLLIVLEVMSFFINKAIGWSLRNYSRTNLVWVINFIIKYRTLMNKLSIKEASKYL